MKYRSKRIVEAVQWDGQAPTADDFLGQNYGPDWAFSNVRKGTILVLDKDGENVDVEVGDWIIKEDDGYEVWSDKRFKEEFELAQP